MEVRFRIVVPKWLLGWQLAATKKIILRLAPNKKQDTDQVVLYKDDDLTLFVSSDKKELFETNQLIFQLLSHT